jgi:hypothetical protein
VLFSNIYIAFSIYTLLFITNICWIGKYEFLKIALKEIFLLLTISENLFMNTFRVKTDWQVRFSVNLKRHVPQAHDVSN